MMDIVKKIKAIQSEAEREFGLPLDHEVWSYIEEQTRDDVKDYVNDDDIDPETQQDYIEAYKHETEKYVGM